MKTNEENKECDGDMCDIQPFTVKSPSSPQTPFWTDNPNILFDTSHITEFFPTEEMSYPRKLNAISRAVIYATILVFAYTRSIRTLIISAITLFSVYLVHSYHVKEKESGKQKETFSDLVRDTLEEADVELPSTEIFQAPTPVNPFSNVLLSDYDYNVNKKPAPPSFNQNVAGDVLLQAKQMVREMNGDQPEIVDKLFKDLGEQFVFEQSLRPFHSTSNTTIPNDQQAFAEFCYGSMVSCKEGNKFACARNLARHTM